MNQKLVFLFVLILNIQAISQNVNNDFLFFEENEKLDSIIDLKKIDFELINKGVFHYSNVHRLKNRRKTLEYDEILEKSANLHSVQMVKYSFFDHINRRNKLYRNLEDRAKYVGYKNYVELAENIYYGFIDLESITSYREMILTIAEAFIQSKSHNQNLLNRNIQEMGNSIVFTSKPKDGFLYYYFTQSLGSQI